MPSRRTTLVKKLKNRELARIFGPDRNSSFESFLTLLRESYIFLAFRQCSSSHAASSYMNAPPLYKKIIQNYS